MSGADFDRLDQFAEETVARIRADHEHGASWLAREAVRALGQVAAGSGEPDKRLRRAHRLGQGLALARPSMGAIGGAVAQIWWDAERDAISSGDQLERLGAAARSLDDRWSGAVDGMLRWARTTAPESVLTLSRSGSVEAVLSALARERAAEHALKVIALESRPGGEGAELARALAEAGAQVTLAPDSACAALINDVSLALVGADGVLADGSVSNKIGTRTLASVAKAAGKPIFALAERLKVIPTSYPFSIEDAPAVALPTASRPDIRVYSGYFDVTPADLLNGIVMDDGLCSLAAIHAYAEDAERAYASLMRQ